MRKLAWLPALLACVAAILAPEASDPRGAVAQRPTVARTERGGPQLRVVQHVRTGVEPKSVEVSPDGRRLGPS